MELALQNTRSAFLWTRVLSVPCWALLTMLSFILYKDLHISAFQITLIAALKPLSALLAPYWSASIHQRQDRLVSNLVWANVLRFLPFLFFPWIQSSWFIIFAFCLYMILSRGAMPAWMEVFKRNIPELARERVFAYGTALDYFGTALLPLLLGIALDEYDQAWRWLFPISALFGLGSTLFLLRIPNSSATISSKIEEPQLKEQLLRPWKQSLALIKSRPDFARYQLGFMFGGAGLMVMQPALPYFFIDVLHLSYTKLLIALAVCKGLGLAFTSPMWVSYFRKVNIFRFSSTVTAIAALFPLLLLGAQYEIGLIYIAYILYGMMQAGSEMSWHLSGPIFAKENDSSIFSSTNVLTVGLRGCVFPFLGGALFAATSPSIVMILGASLCLIATRSLFSSSLTLVSAPATPK